MSHRCRNIDATRERLNPDGVTAPLFDMLLPEARPSLEAQVPFMPGLGEAGEYAMMIRHRVASLPLNGLAFRPGAAAHAGAALTA